jgi:hypothetical protein
MDNGFEIVDMAGTSKGILKKLGGREVTVSAKLIAGAAKADNDWYMDELFKLYVQYYNRVNHKEEVGS